MCGFGLGIKGADLVTVEQFAHPKRNKPMFLATWLFSVVLYPQSAIIASQQNDANLFLSSESNVSFRKEAVMAADHEDAVEALLAAMADAKLSLIAARERKLPGDKGAASTAKVQGRSPRGRRADRTGAQPDAESDSSAAAESPCPQTAAELLLACLEAIRNDWVCSGGKAAFLPPPLMKTT